MSDREERLARRKERRRKRIAAERKVTVPAVLFYGLIAALVILAVVLWSTKRRQDTHLRVEDPGELRALLPSIAGLTHGVIVPGNSITIHQNGAFFDALLADIARAKKTIHFETYVWWKGDICRRVAEALSAKAKEGVEVRLLVDWSGSSRRDKKLFEMMSEAGVKVARFHPVRISNLGRLNNRDHRKIIVIDGVTGYVGGHGIADEWTGNAQDKEHWRDTFARVEGPIVGQLRSAFSENWIEETGEVFVGDLYFPPLQPAGTIPMHLAYSSPSGSVSSVQLLYYLAISAAKNEILIQNPYFLPDPGAIEALERAVARGVDVRIMLPSTNVTDSALVQHASHHRFGALLDRGIRIYEYEKTLLHQKVMIVDGFWSTIGSTNFDDRSFELNDEVSLGIVDEGVARELRDAFMNDLRSATPVDARGWKDRRITHKLIDGFAFLGNEQL